MSTKGRYGLMVYKILELLIINFFSSYSLDSSNQFNVTNSAGHGLHP